MPRRRVRFRPPGVKPWTKIGPLGPFRGRLGLAWVIAPLVVGVLLVLFAWLLLFRHGAPGGSFEPVGSMGSFPDGRARAVSLPGVFVGNSNGQLYAVLQEDGCTLTICGLDKGYEDCRGARYGLDGVAPNGAGALDLLPLKVDRGTVYVDPDHPVVRSPAPAASGVFGGSPSCR